MMSCHELMTLYVVLMSLETISLTHVSALSSLSRCLFTLLLVLAIKYMIIIINNRTDLYRASLGPKIQRHLNSYRCHSTWFVHQLLDNLLKTQPNNNRAFRSKDTEALEQL